MVLLKYKKKTTDNVLDGRLAPCYRKMEYVQENQSNPTKKVLVLIYLPDVKKQTCINLIESKEVIKN